MKIENFNFNKSPLSNKKMLFLHGYVSKTKIQLAKNMTLAIIFFSSYYLMPFKWVDSTGRHMTAAQMDTCK